MPTNGKGADVRLIDSVRLDEPGLACQSRRTADVRSLNQHGVRARRSDAVAATTTRYRGDPVAGRRAGVTRAVRSAHIESGTAAAGEVLVDASADVIYDLVADATRMEPTGTDVTGDCEILRDIPWCTPLAHRWAAGVEDRKEDLEANIRQTLDALRAAAEAIATTRGERGRSEFPPHRERSRPARRGVAGAAR